MLKMLIKKNKNYSKMRTSEVGVLWITGICNLVLIPYSIINKDYLVILPFIIIFLTIFFQFFNIENTINIQILNNIDKRLLLISGIGIIILIPYTLIEKEILIFLIYELLIFCKTLYHFLKE